MEFILFGTAQGDKCSIERMENLHLFIQDVSHQAETVFGMVIEDPTIDFVLVNALGQQFADNQIDFPIVGIEGETSRIGHHPCVNTFGPFL